ncbi:MAG: VWA domain-containing protein [Terracidiphilus sp.]|nr:VWA domain-containing protein [Terracidiphilus sp.]MDR3797773.1 VWA domain-containing protein [Terracidiphilus sp.]
MPNKRYRIVACVVVFLGTLLSSGGGSRFAAAQDSGVDSGIRLRVHVNLVQLNVAVTDSKGNYITGLRPEDFVIMEDKVPQKLNTFEEGNFNPGAPGTVASPRAGKVAGTSGDSGQTLPTISSSGVRISPLAGADVFILFDTSNYMYRGFVFAQDAISDFVRSMDDASKIAFYSYSRDLSRATMLTADRFHVVNGVRSTVAGDDAALYNSLLLTVKDAAPLTGRKAIVVFSNGPDNASSIPPEDVAELAQSTGTIIYIVSTRQAQEDLVSAAAFERMSRVTGGKAYFAGNWSKEKQAFQAIQRDLGHLYSLSYYPQPNPNHGWRSISVKLVGKDLQKYHIRTRDGYSLQQQTQVNSEAYLEPNTNNESK